MGPVMSVVALDIYVLTCSHMEQGVGKETQLWFAATALRSGGNSSPSQMAWPPWIGLDHGLCAFTQWKQARDL